MTVIDTRGWGEFPISKLFKVSRPAARVKLGYLAGDVPFVSTSSSNNGVSEWVDPGHEVLEPGNCITVSALDGTAFWQPQDFLGRGGAGSSISILRRENLSELVGLFLASTITAACHANYSSMLSGTMIRNVILRLPITSPDNPDWDYMERTMRRVVKERETALDRLQAFIS